MDARALFRRYGKGENGALHFGARRFDGFARLLRHGAGKLFFALGNALRHLPSTRCRSNAGNLRVVPKAFTAAAMAASACSRLP